jgi:mannose-6-phosphate isomerase
MTDLYPMLVRPRFSERIWGGHRLVQQLGKEASPDRPIGESWEIYEENEVCNGEYAGQTIGQLRGALGRKLTGHVSPDEVFPLLTKLIDARDVLSVQVHPDDHFAQVLEHESHGKTECWYIVDAAPGSELIYGFARDSSPDEYVRLVEEGTLEQVLRPVPATPGEVVYIPAGTVHAIGAGILLFELQQTSDVTYRIYDWNRRDDSGKPRELHVEKARQVLNYRKETRGPVHPLKLPGGSRVMLVAGPYFTLELIETSSVQELTTHDSPVLICALGGALEVEAGGMAVAVGAFSSALIPAGVEGYSLRAGGGQAARVLVGYVPMSQEATREELRGQGFSEGEIEGFLTQFRPVEHLGSAGGG